MFKQVLKNVCTVFLCTGTESCLEGGKCMHSVLYIYEQVLKNVCTVYLYTGTESCTGGGIMYEQCTVYLCTGTEECMYRYRRIYVQYIYVQVLDHVLEGGKWSWNYYNYLLSIGDKVRKTKFKGTVHVVSSLKGQFT